MTNLALATGLAVCTCTAPASGKFPLPTVDLAEATDKHVVVAQGTDIVYHGHPTTLLMPDGKTIFAVWNFEHGGFCGPMKRSADGGLTWSRMLEVPTSWRVVKNCPTIWNLAGPDGKKRLVVYAGTGAVVDSMHFAVSEDQGETWSEMRPSGLGPAVMPFCTIEPIRGGKALLGMTNARRPDTPEEDKTNMIVQSISTDGGLTWEPWETVLDIPDLKPCEPWIVRSPDGGELLCLLRENVKRVALQMTSRDEGRTWSEPKPLPVWLHGDRHVARYLPDGRLLVCFRDKASTSPSRNHFVAWIGNYEDILRGEDNGYRIKLLHSHKGSDCGYPGVEILPDGTVVATTYIKYRPGSEQNSIVSVRFHTNETDALAEAEGWGK